MKKLIILNNKSNLTKEKFVEYQNQLREIHFEDNLVLCPSTCYLALFNLDNYLLGSQNVSAYPEGSHTGEVAASQLKSLNVSYTIVGHSERRNENRETDKEIQDKIKYLLREDIIPILCVGESLEEYQNKETISSIRSNIEIIMQEVENKEKIIIAYEPTWSIGTGLTPSIEEINQVIEEIKINYPQNHLLYGGSLNKKNISLLNNNSSLDGYLLGNLSLNIEDLKQCIEILE